MRPAIAALAVVLVAFFAVAHFDSPATDFGVTQERGVAALAEQGLAAIVFFAYFLLPSLPWRVMFVALQFWPLVLVSWRPWHLLSPWTRVLTLVYAVVIIFVWIGLAVWLHLRWHPFFFSP